MIKGIIAQSTMTISPLKKMFILMIVIMYIIWNVLKSKYLIIIKNVSCLKACYWDKRIPNFKLQSNNNSINDRFFLFGKNNFDNIFYPMIEQVNLEANKM